MAHENATPRPWYVVPATDGEWTIQDRKHGGGSCIARNYLRSKIDNGKLIVEAVNAYDTLRAERDALREENERLKEAASLSAMYLKTGFISCPRCKSDVDTADTDAEYTLRKALGK